MVDLAMSVGRKVKLFRNGRNQVVRIPRAFEMPGEVAFMRQEGVTLVIERPPAGGPNAKLVALLATMTPLTDDDAFPEIDDLSLRSRRSLSGFMLDTNMVSDLLKSPAGVVARRIGAADAAISISVIVAAELRYGAAKKASARLSDSVEGLLSVIDIEPLAPPTDVIYGRLRSELERAGAPLSANDLLIAAHALALDRTLVSHDGAFARVPDLKLEDWLGA